MELYLHKYISVKSTLDFITRLMKESSTDVHCFQMYCNNELMVRAAATPYSNTQKRQLYSMSKSVTSTAVGIACNMGLCSLYEIQ